MYRISISLSLLLWMVIILFSCTHEAEIKRDYPLVNTEQADLITRTSARLNAMVQEGQISSITQYGFVWGTSTVLNINDSTKFSINGFPETGRYDYSTGQILNPNQRYYVRSFIRVDSLIIYGNMIHFSTLDNEPGISRATSANHP